uniref:binding partner of ACD11 1-like n=1 Tax=Erigeron canadensis TaxID=72917 RepID=UPI001CB9C435|nr:binding partner of ACD11 1-like [Erigeron canadensis]
MSSVKTVKVGNLSLKASQRDVREFFSFSGDIIYVEVQSNDESSQNAFVTFTDSQGADTAVLLSGATIVDTAVTVTLAPEYQLPPEATAALSPRAMNTPENESALRKAEDVVSSMFAKGFVLGKDAVSKAKSFDEKHGLTSTASAKVASFDKKIGFTEKVSTGTSIVNEKVKEVDQKLQVSEKAKSAFAAAEQTVSNAGSAIMKNRYVFTSASWVTGAFNKVVKTASEVGQQTKEKVGKADDGDKQKVVDDFAQVHLSESPKASAPIEPQEQQQQPPSKPEPVQGLIL